MDTTLIFHQITPTHGGKFAAHVHWNKGGSPQIYWEICPTEKAAEKYCEHKTKQVLVKIAESYHKQVYHAMEKSGTLAQAKLSAIHYINVFLEAHKNSSLEKLKLSIWNTRCHYFKILPGPTSRYRLYWVKTIDLLMNYCKPENHQYEGIEQEAKAAA